MFGLRRLVSLLTAVSACLASVSCEQAAQDAASPAESPVVTVSRPIQRTITDYEEFTGTTDAVDAVDVRARVSGRLDKVCFIDSEEVKKDQLLFEIDPRPYQFALHGAEGQLATLRARLAHLKLDLARAEELRPKNAISGTDYDKIVGEVAEVRASLESAQAAVDHAQFDLDNTKVTAPMAGKISRHLISAGNLVAADSTLLTNIVAVDPMRVYFDVDERKMLQIEHAVREGKIKVHDRSQMEVQMGLATEQGFPHQGVIDFADNRVDHNTGTIQLRGRFPNPLPPLGSRILTPGLFARLRVSVGQPHRALLVAEKALGTDQGQKYLLVVDAKNEVQYRSVITGKQEGGLRIIPEGLRPDDDVIVTGLQRVRPGLTVAPKRVGMETFVSGSGAEVPPRAAAAPETKPKGAAAGLSSGASSGTAGQAGSGAVSHQPPQAK